MKIKENLFQYFEKAGTKIQYKPSEIIYMQEDRADSFYLITKGRVRVFFVLPSGKEVTYAILKRGSIFGESSISPNSVRPTTVFAVDDVELIACKLDQLYPYLTESKELTISLLQMLTERLDAVSESLRQAHTYNRFEKVAAFLLQCLNTQETDADTPSVSYSHQEISTFVGLSHVTTSNVLKSFEKKGLLKLQYGYIEILDINGLKKIVKT